MFRTYVSICLLLFVAAALPGAAANAAPAGDVIVAKTQGNGIILWDITRAVAGIVAAPGTKDAKVRNLEIEAAKLLLGHLTDMAAATSVEVRVFYQKTGEASEIYRANTFGGVEKMFTVASKVDAAKRNKATWETQLSAGALPAGLAVNVEGELP